MVIKKKYIPIGVWIFLSGALHTLGFAPFYLWPLSLLALAFLAYLTAEAKNWRQAFMAGFLFGLGHFLTSTYWLPRSFYVDSGGDVSFMLYAGIPALIGVALYLSFFIAIPCALTRFLTASRWLSPFLFTTLMLGSELLRSHPYFGFPWNLTGYIFADNPQLMQPAAVGTVYLLSFLALLAAALGGSWSPRGLMSFVIIALMWSYGYLKTRDLPPIGMQTPVASLRLIQPNLETAHNWDPIKRQAYLNQHIALSSLPRKKPADIIIWSETAVAFFLNQDEELRHILSLDLQKNQTLVLGYPKEEEQGQTRLFYNSMATLLPNGEILSDYDKHILVPFGEYIPFRRLLDYLPTEIRTLAYNRGEYTRGTHQPSLRVGHNLTAFPLICYEAIFPLFIRKHLKDQNFLLNITNDSWFDGTTALHQHFAMARMRAVETGLPLVRVGNTGITAVVDGYGRIVAHIPPNQVKVLDTFLPPPKKMNKE